MGVGTELHVSRPQGNCSTRVVSVNGEIDVDSSPCLTRTLLDLQQSFDVLDCRGVSFIDASGLTALLTAQESQSFVLLGSPSVNRLVDLCGLRQSLHLLDLSPMRAPS